MNVRITYFARLNINMDFHIYNLKGILVLCRIIRKDLNMLNYAEQPVAYINKEDSLRCQFSKDLRMFILNSFAII